MNFTREPIIETIITPKDGYRLIIRSTKHSTDEEFVVDAVEIVSFGLALFLRNQEKPKPFLLPVSDYQVVEGKEARVMLKAALLDRTIKIGGGKEPVAKKEMEVEEEVQETVHKVDLFKAVEEKIGEETVSETILEHKRERRRHRRRRSHELREEQKQKRGSDEAVALSNDTEDKVQEAAEEALSSTAEMPPVVQVAPASFPQLIPPPTTLISASIQKYKDQQSQEAVAPTQEVKEDESRVEHSEETDDFSQNDDSFLF